MANEVVDTDRAIELLRGILERMGIAAKVELREEEDKRVLDVVCDAEDDLQRVIGRRGQVVDALQHLVGKMLIKGKSEKADKGEKADGRGKPIVVDAGGYRQRHIERLEGLAARMAEKAKSTGKPVDLNPMPAHDRRIVHMALANVEGVSTRSEGEGDLRHIVVVPGQAT
ncbi:MAG TPA: R3H domain-containing nucleic acid-binding protein [Kofleriaceae bacterium]|nr:R3H domain-containing nucleic acid-binding protein [Kofleriaceae bacterium]